MYADIVIKHHLCLNAVKHDYREKPQTQEH